MNEYTPQSFNINTESHGGWETFAFPFWGVQRPILRGGFQFAGFVSGSGFQETPWKLHNFTYRAGGSELELMGFST